MKRPTTVKVNEALFIFEVVRFSGETQDSLVAFCRGEFFALIAVRAPHPRVRCIRRAWTKPIKGGSVCGGDYPMLDNNPSDTFADPSNRDSNNGIVSSRHERYERFPAVESVQRSQPEAHNLGGGWQVREAAVFSASDGRLAATDRKLFGTQGEGVHRCESRHAVQCASPASWFPGAAWRRG